MAWRPSCAQVHASKISSSVPIAARQRDEGVRQLGHLHLPLVHRRGDVQLGEAPVRDLLPHDRLGHHARHAAAEPEHGVGQRRP